MNMTVFIALTAVLSLIIAFLSIILSTRSRSKMSHVQKRIGRVLDREGFGWGKTEGQLFVEKKGHRFLTRFETLAERGCVRVFFLHSAEDPSLKAISTMGRLVMASNLNEKHLGTVTLFDGSQIRNVCYADIQTADDFLFEFLRAYQSVGSLMHDYSQIKEWARQEFPEKQEQFPRIGFAS